MNLKSLAISTLVLIAPLHLAAMTLTSSALKPGQAILQAQVFNSFGCTGQNLSPDLSWSGAPKETKAFAITMYDPDAPTGSGWWHWLLFNIPSSVTSLPAGLGHGKAALPNGAIESRTDFGTVGYGGPCPPKGSKAHRYIFTVYALKEAMPIDKDASGAMVGFYANSLKLAEAKLEANFAQP